MAAVPTTLEELHARLCRLEEAHMELADQARASALDELRSTLASLEDRFLEFQCGSPISPSQRKPTKHELREAIAQSQSHLRMESADLGEDLRGALKDLEARFQERLELCRSPASPSERRATKREVREAIAQSQSHLRMESADLSDELRAALRELEGRLQESLSRQLATKTQGLSAALARLEERLVDLQRRASVAGTLSGDLSPSQQKPTKREVQEAIALAESHLRIERADITDEMERSVKNLDMQLRQGLTKQASTAEALASSLAQLQARLAEQPAPQRCGLERALQGGGALRPTASRRLSDAAVDSPLFKRGSESSECETPASPASVAAPEAPACPHALIEFAAPDATFSCDACATSVPSGATLHGCARCNYDLCPACHGRAVRAETPCPACRRPLQASQASDDTFSCDGCRGRLLQGARLHSCRTCNYDLCPRCAAVSELS